ncbi:MAG: hypothetical protein ACYC4Q_08525 [Victivallaceae bacterium]
MVSGIDAAGESFKAMMELPVICHSSAGASNSTGGFDVIITNVIQFFSE